jgi:hypothetical protein
MPIMKRQDRLPLSAQSSEGRGRQAKTYTAQVNPSGKGLIAAAPTAQQTAPEERTVPPRPGGTSPQPIMSRPSGDPPGAGAEALPMSIRGMYTLSAPRGSGELPCRALVLHSCLALALPSALGHSALVLRGTDRALELEALRTRGNLVLGVPCRASPFLSGLAKS